MFDGRDVTAWDDSARPAATAEWREADQNVRRIAVRRAGLDAEEARWLVAARRTGVHRHVGCATLHEYLERILGYGPRAASERLRIADKLETLPQMREALSSGRLAFSAVRELTRVATPATEAAWIDAATGRTLREIEPMVAGRREGDPPGTPPDRERLRHRVSFEVSGATLALLRDARIHLEDELADGERLDDDGLVAALCRAVLGGGEQRAAYQVAVTTCDSCQRAWQDGAGAAIEIDAATIERVECDAQRIGRVDAARPARATQDIPPSVRRLVWRRDHGRCVVPGCRSARHLELHHLVPRAAGGSHAADNLVLACDGHHVALHEGRLRVAGTIATGLTFTRADGTPYGAPPSPMIADAIAALTGLGYPAARSRKAVAEAATHVGAGATLEDLIKRALAACRPPTT